MSKFGQISGRFRADFGQISGRFRAAELNARAEFGGAPELREVPELRAALFTLLLCAVALRAMSVKKCASAWNASVTRLCDVIMVISKRHNSHSNSMFLSRKQPLNRFN